MSAEGSKVVRSLHNREVDRCVDIIARGDGSFCFREFRRDPEDQGAWTFVSEGAAGYASAADAEAAAWREIEWLRGNS